MRVEVSSLMIRPDEVEDMDDMIVKSLGDAMIKIERSTARTRPPGSGENFTQ